MWKQGAAVLAAMAVFTAGSVFAGGAVKEKVLKMTTTTDVEASGLFDELLPKFKADSGIVVKLSVKDDAAVLQDCRDGRTDIIFSQDKTGEKRLVLENFGTMRYPVMHSDYIIVGPKNDPAGIKGIQSVTEALAKIAEKHSTFASCGDNSGTHIREQMLWKESSVKLVERKTQFIEKGKLKKVDYVAPEDAEAWYRTVGRGMAETLSFAEEKQACTLSDRDTYVRFRYGQEPPLDLEVLCEGDALLERSWGLVPVNSSKFPGVHNALAMEFVQWISSPKGQELISNFTLAGIRLFTPDAEPVK
ncbi:substrate-binding domain-containing protein [Desulforhopalus vacuolatus]|uniref:substrate-binding domain-containing protein n=1 Tax=Desulforhopalus vacuolatus TaxID=40414 RepID=UPI001964E9BF|nr:substrate-binding domain-containing protein [Desulforhopalus vacuolatus]MBM9518369.1 substrate-binding domain-containing protein [Desulforhopalus vacuolatus]